ncbi:MAG: histidinol-phosphate transaminase [Proteobacteria bacterium]|nr:histidinol-phosphate transaminase [Pseudomonadota bacterium]
MSSRFFETLAPQYIHDLPVYQPGKPIEEVERELGIESAIKIASNENPMGPSPRAVKAAKKAIESAHWYPDGGAFRLRSALADRLEIELDEVIVGAGSNEIIHMIVQALCRPGVDEVLTHRYAFISYRLAAMAHNVPFVQAEVTDQLACDADALIASMSSRTKVVFLANPNNPTGAYVNTRDFERIVDALPEQALLVVDEAYHEYATYAHELGEVEYPQSQAVRSRDMPRIFTLRTFSKIYGLSGLRVGYGIGDRRVVDLINRVRRPFNVSSVAQVAALAALDDQEHVSRSRQAARSSIAALRDCAGSLGLKSYPSLGNFVLFDVGRDAVATHEELLREGVIVRPMAAWGLPTCLRISVGTAEQTERAIRTLGDVLGSSTGGLAGKDAT